MLTTHISRILDIVLSCFPVELKRRMGFKILRSIPEFRAYTDTLIRPYEDTQNWRSGLGRHNYILFGLVRTLNPNVVVEIGSARGKSTCMFALACKQNGHGKVYAIDPHDQNPWAEGMNEINSGAFLRERLREYDLIEWSEILEMTSQEAAKKWKSQIDLLFIDGDHTYQGVRHDFEAFKPYLAERALVIFHDTSWDYYRNSKDYNAACGVPAYLNELRLAGYQSVTFDSMPGLTVLDPQLGGFAFLKESTVKST